ncbi:hypothetical protein GCM10009416_05530 [Craurococcus roseus]|uniref:DRBM domain-containing protein n=1 Tax=Craurococcus roseus TaxID=77585 RepID=A0ABN1EP76_9PROT
MSRVNSGKMWPNKPDCSVEVVEATVMDRSGGWAPAPRGGTAGEANAAKAAIKNLRNIAFLPSG